MNNNSNGNLNNNNYQNNNNSNINLNDNNNIMNVNPLYMDQRQLMINSMNNNNINPNQNIYFSPNMNNLQNNNNLVNPNAKNDINYLMLRKKDENLINNCVTLCKEQLECRLLQKKIDEDPSIASNIIYDKIKDKVQEISCDQFGNYFIQKVIDNLNEEQIRELLYKKISSNFRSFCFNQHGTRVVQKIFEKIINNEELLNYYNILLTPNLKDFVVD